MMNDGPTNLIMLARAARKNGLLDACSALLDRINSSSMRTDDCFGKIREHIMVRGGSWS